TLINELILPLDPRGFNVHSHGEPTEEERYYPFLWRFWRLTPTRGRFAIFDRSWNRRVVADRVAGDVKGKALRQAFEDIRAFERLKKAQGLLRDLEHEIYRRRVPVLIAYEGWDAAGKGGNIRRLTQNLDPRGYEVVPVAAPNDVEKAHHYLWRFWQHMPKAGHITIFDRTWYGRVLVERVEGFC